LATSGWGQDFDLLANGWESLSNRERAGLQEISRCVGIDDPLEPLRVDLCDRCDVAEEGRQVFVRAVRRKPPQLTTEEIL
jgi:hypothetical protein